MVDYFCFLYSAGGPVFLVVVIFALIIALAGIYDLFVMAGRDWMVLAMGALLICDAIFQGYVAWWAL